MSLSDVTLSNGKRLADIDDVVTGAALDFQVGAVAELTVTGVDPGDLLKAGLLDAGSTLTYDGHKYEVAAVERDYQGIGIVLSFAARSRLARRLRNTMGPETSTGLTPGAWITRAVKRAGGTALVQPGAKRRKIVQKRGESVLDTIGNLASDMATEWVEWGNKLYVGTGWWALQDGPKLPMWPVKITSASCLAFASRSSLDDRDSAATASLDVPVELGKKIRPWHRIEISGATKEDNGPWLVQDVAYDLSDIATGAISLYRPLKSSVKKSGSTSTGTGADTANGDLSSLNGDWIDGDTKVWRNCTRTPRQYVAWAQKQVGSGWGQNRCLAWVSVAIGGREGHGGDYARLVWEKRPAGTPASPGDTSPPIGAIVVWGPPTGGGAGHVGISIGGGKFISATGGRVQVLSIAGFGSYYGAMAPNFFV